MEVLRTSGLAEITVDLPTDYPNEDFTVLVYDGLSASSFEVTATANAGGVVQLTLPSYYKKYDGEFDITLTNSQDEELVSYGVSVLRPYIDPATAATKLGISVQDATEYERVARFIIDSKTGGFRRCRKTVSAVGMGLDYLPMQERITKIWSVTENGDPTEPGLYTISTDQTSVVAVDDEDRNEFKPVWRTRWQAPGTFLENWDYEVDGDFGWATIPAKIQEATLLLIQDISCGNNRHINKYVVEYQTDGYRVKYADSVFQTTGNAVVDKILASYGGEIRLRVL